MQAIVRKKPFELFHPVEVRDSQYIKDFPKSVLVKPHPNRFELWVDGQRAGIWEITISHGSPEYWPEFPETHYLRSQIFRIRRGFRRSDHHSWYAAAFKQAVLDSYLRPTFRGWLMEGNVEHPAMKIVFEHAHQVARQVDLGRNGWQMFTFLD